MRCPRCDHNTTVAQTRARYKHGRWKHYTSPEDLDVRRRRHCPACGFRFTTYETADLTPAELESLRPAQAASDSGRYNP